MRILWLLVMQLVPLPYFCGTAFLHVTRGLVFLRSWICKAEFRILDLGCWIFCPSGLNMCVWLHRSKLSSSTENSFLLVLGTA